jgi:DNA-binding phage protein
LPGNAALIADGNGPSDDKVAELLRRIAAGERKATIARDLGISRETLYQYLRVAA